MSYLLVGLVSFALGALLVSCMSVLMWRRLVTRLQGKHGLVSLTRELENRRVAIESGREHLVRATAGRPARISDGLVTRPGMLARRRVSGDQ